MKHLKYELTNQTGFNPCFNGFMDKCGNARLCGGVVVAVSTLVLMDSWINAIIAVTHPTRIKPGFNPCFNGFMDKCRLIRDVLYTDGMFQPLF